MNNLHKQCLICKSTKLLQLKSYEKAHLVKCSKCGLVFSKKIPTEQELIDFYKGYGRDDYLSPITIKRYQELLNEFEKYKKTGNILDVGSGIGYFLEEAKKRGWNVYGTEYTDEAISICEKKGINMQKGILNPKNYDIIFDVITSFEVIEHINNPQEEIKNIYSLLRERGLFYCTTPNFNSISRLILKNKWNNIIYPEHLSYYTPSTLSKLLKDYSLKPFKILTTGISISRIKTSINNKSNNGISENSEDEKIRVRSEIQIVYKLLKNILNKILTILKIGDALKIYAVKK
jgi:2-polyprenyl-3-methyl-5-hydroxy-6-metoxy-1,4-benzoquinol methylase